MCSVLENVFCLRECGYGTKQSWRVRVGSVFMSVVQVYECFGVDGSMRVGVYECMSVIAVMARRAS